MNKIGARKKTLALQSLILACHRHRGGRPNAGGQESLMDRALKIRPQNIGLPVRFQTNRLNPAKISHQRRPGHIDAAAVESFLQVHLQAQGQEAGHDVPDRRVVAVMEDRPDVQRAFRFSKRPFHPPQAFIGLGDFRSGELGIGPQDILPVVAGLGSHLVLIDPHRAFRHPEIPGIALVRDQALGPARKLLPEMGQDRLPRRFVFPLFLFVQTDDIAAVPDQDFLDLQGLPDLVETTGPGQDRPTDLLLFPHPAAEDVVNDPAACRGVIDLFVDSLLILPAVLKRKREIRQEWSGTVEEKRARPNRFLSKYAYTVVFRMDDDTKKLLRMGKDEYDLYREGKRYIKKAGTYLPDLRSAS